MSMKYYSTIDELIEHVEKEDLTYRNLHTTIFMDINNEIIKIPYQSLAREYIHFLEKTVVYVQMNDKEKAIYRFKPKRLSNDLYGTTELWSALLEINYKSSIIDFDCEKSVKVFDPKLLKKMINEILILENVIS